jgi:hypothetical protein
VDALTGFPNGHKLTPAQPTPAPPGPTPAPPAPAPTPACVFQADADWHPETAMGTAPVGANASACCDACHAAAGCVVGVLFDGTCYLKVTSVPACLRACLPGKTAALSVVGVLGCLACLDLGWRLACRLAFGSAGRPVCLAGLLFLYPSLAFACLLRLLLRCRCFAPAVFFARAKGAADVLGGQYTRPGRTACLPPPSPSPPNASSPSCPAEAFEMNADYLPSTERDVLPAPDPAACCDLCANRSDFCVAAVWFGGQCYRKAQADVAGGKYARPGRVACAPVRHHYRRSAEKHSSSTTTATATATAATTTTATPANGSAAVAVVVAAVAPRTGGEVFLSTSSSSPAFGDSPFPGGDDIHGPYQHGGMFPAVNGGGTIFAPPTVVDVQPAYAVGAAQPG